MSVERVAVIGAGMSGLWCATRLRDAGLEVAVFDKARGAGGRMSTRRADEYRYDHGAQYFTVRDPRFRHVVSGWQREGVVALWNARIRVLTNGTSDDDPRPADRFVGVPAMNSALRLLSDGLPVQYETRITRVMRSNRGWRLWAEDGTDCGEFDVVVSTLPAPQMRMLFHSIAPELSIHASAARMSGCITGMVTFERPLDLEFDAAFVRASALSWVANNSSKPGRPTAASWVLQAAPDWSDAHMEDDPDRHLDTMLAEFSRAVRPDDPIDLPPIVHSATHRWRYSAADQPIKRASLYDESLGLAACGDWCNGPRVEGAFLSGDDLASRILASR